MFGLEVPVMMYCDNQSALALAKNDTFHQRTKHIGIWYHLIRENVAAGSIVTQFVPTESQQADILTKRLPSGLSFAKQRSLLMVAL